MSSMQRFSPEFILSVNPDNFDQEALALYRYQYQHNTIYQQYAQAVNKTPEQVHSIFDIPFLPINFFKTHQVKTGEFHPTTTFLSSGTTQTISSQHYINNTQYYLNSCRRTFIEQYGSIEDYVFLCLLPNYLEKGNSSLVFMAQDFINLSKHSESGFYLNDVEALSTQIKAVKDHKKVILLGVTFALLDFADAYPMDLSNVIIMETGGMKGRKEEWSRNKVHEFLASKWNVSAIHSEYGMTELLSQGYSKGAGIYIAGPTMKVLLREENDPFYIYEQGAGCVNIIDLANVESCAFIATEDLGKVHENGTFEIIGRMDYSALRGCSLMAL